MDTLPRFTVFLPISLRPLCPDLVLRQRRDNIWTFRVLEAGPFRRFPRAAFRDGPFHANPTRHVFETRSRIPMLSERHNRSMFSDETVGDRWDKIIDKYGKKNWLACN